MYDLDRTIVRIDREFDGNTYVHYGDGSIVRQPREICVEDYLSGPKFSFSLPELEGSTKTVNVDTLIISFAYSDVKEDKHGVSLDELSKHFQKLNGYVQNQNAVVTAITMTPNSNGNGGKVDVTIQKV